MADFQRLNATGQLPPQAFHSRPLLSSPIQRRLVDPSRAGVSVFGKYIY